VFLGGRGGQLEIRLLLDCRFVPEAWPTWPLDLNLTQTGLQCVRVGSPDLTLARKLKTKIFIFSPTLVTVCPKLAQCHESSAECIPLLLMVFYGYCSEKH